MTSLLPYDPGVLPTRPSPAPGEAVRIEVDGLPPIKDVSQSIRNPAHALHDRFRRLRSEAIAVMAGRAWSFGPIEVEVLIQGPIEERQEALYSYLGGVLDTLDGSSGFTFTFLPIVFEDDSQVVASSVRWQHCDMERYAVQVAFHQPNAEA
jgi:hypothetical protein